jgi:hypothetical protein
MKQIYLIHKVSLLKSGGQSRSPVLVTPTDKMKMAYDACNYIPIRNSLTVNADTIESPSG